MQILHFNTFDGRGGAAINAYRIHDALRNGGHTSRMFVAHKTTQDPDVLESSCSFRLPLRIYKGVRRRIPKVVVNEAKPPTEYLFNFLEMSPIPNFCFRRFPRNSVDIIFLHWLNGLCEPRAIASLYRYYRCPIVWFLCDMEPFTGGCHYSFDCNRYQERCGQCPCLRSSSAEDISSRQLAEKGRWLANLPITFVCGGEWPLEKVRRSSLFSDHKAVRVPGCYDKQVFCRSDSAVARAQLSIPTDKTVLLLGAVSLADTRKRLSLCFEALEFLHAALTSSDHGIKPGDIFIVLIGEPGANTNSIPFDSKYLGFIETDQGLSQAYNSCDLFVCGSTEDVGPGMVVESLLCETPVVGFNTGIIPDAVQNMENGIVVAEQTAQALADAILKLLLNPIPKEKLQSSAERLRPSFCNDHAVKAYEELFKSLIADHSG